MSTCCTRTLHREENTINLNAISHLASPILLLLSSCELSLASGTNDCYWWGIKIMLVRKNCSLKCFILHQIGRLVWINSPKPIACVSDEHKRYSVRHHETPRFKTKLTSFFISQTPLPFSPCNLSPSTFAWLGKKRCQKCQKMKLYICKQGWTRCSLISKEETHTVPFSVLKPHHKSGVHQWCMTRGSSSMSVQGSEIVFILLTHYCFFPPPPLIDSISFIVTSFEKKKKHWDAFVWNQNVGTAFVRRDIWVKVKIVPLRIEPYTV